VGTQGKVTRLRGQLDRLHARGVSRRRRATARGHAEPPRRCCGLLGAVYGSTACGATYGAGESTEELPRPPYAELHRGRHVVSSWARARSAPERGEDDAGANFYFICADSNIHNSLKWQLS
jgi:hypothetical protein